MTQDIQKLDTSAKEAEGKVAMGMGIIKSVGNLFKSIGPCLISQTDKSSEAYARHKSRLAVVEIKKNILLDEAKAYNAYREKLLDQLLVAEQEDRIAIAKNIEYAEAKIRQLGIVNNALGYMETQKINEDKNTETSSDISLHWIDKFNELARSNNKSWRADLLSRALAKESVTPGTVLPRALWLIGTLEEQLFHAFASILDLTSNLETTCIIPGDYSLICKQPIQNYNFGNNPQVGNLIYQLSDIDVLANQGTGYTSVVGQNITMGYDQEKYQLISLSEYTISGLFLTPIGNSIATFYNRDPNDTGKKIFSSFIENLKRDPRVNITAL